MKAIHLRNFKNIQMIRNELFRRYALFLCSVFVNAFGISVITKAMLGTSAISSVPFVLSLFTPYTMGQYTIYLNLFFILLEMLMMKKKEIVMKRYELISQIPVGFCFGLFIDISMNYLLVWLSPDYYLAQIVALLVGCFILGLGISLEVKANVSMVAGEYLVQVIAKFVHKEFGFIKVCFDVSLVLIACVLSATFLSNIEGVREGTVIAALAVGPISHLLLPYWRIFDSWLQPIQPYQASYTDYQPIIITIAREYGSGGHLLGKMLAERLNIKFYDKELISMVANDSHFSPKYIAENEQKVSSNYLLSIILQDYEAPIEKSLSSADTLFVSQSRVIRKIAKEQSCVIIGRCADYILKDFPKASIIKVFCYTDMEDASKRCKTEYHIATESVETEIKQINHSRINHYQYYTNQKWGDPHNYDLMINTGNMTLTMACDIIAHLYQNKMSNQTIKKNE